MRLKGIKVLHNKNTADKAPVRLPVPKQVVIPMSMHIGRPAKPVVKIGDSVAVGQLIGEGQGYISSPVHSSVSGTVKRVTALTMSGGVKTDAVVIETDGEQRLFDGIAPPKVFDTESFVAAVRESGIVGLGGAGFPTYVKLDIKDLTKADTVVINCAECEPYITSDTRTMLDRTQDVTEGIKLLKKYLQAKNIIIGIEDNKRACIEKMKSVCQGMQGVTVKVLPSAYPQGGEKVLVYNTTGRLIPKGKLPLDVRVIVINCTTLACIADYIKTGIPLVEKCITVDGTAVQNPCNVIAPIGTPIKDIFEFCGGYKEEPQKILYGGPMMGIAVPSDEMPVLKMTNALIAMGEREARPPKVTPCINCGRCVSHCPLRLDPRTIARAYKLELCEDLRDLAVDLCMECGCCAYVCPAKRPLVQTNKLAKAKLRDYIQKQKQDKEAG